MFKCWALTSKPNDLVLGLVIEAYLDLTHLKGNPQGSADTFFFFLELTGEFAVEPRFGWEVTRTWEASRRNFSNDCSWPCCPCSDSPTSGKLRNPESGQLWIVNGGTQPQNICQSSGRNCRDFPICCLLNEITVGTEYVLIQSWPGSLCLGTGEDEVRKYTCVG